MEYINQLLRHFNVGNTTSTNAVVTPEEERESFIVKLGAWVNNVHGENRQEAARRTMDAYDFAIANPSEDVKLDLSHLHITEVPPLFAGVTNLNLARARVTELPAELPINLTRLTLTHTSISSLPGNLPAGLTYLCAYQTQVTELPANLPPGVNKNKLNNQLKHNRTRIANEQSPMPSQKSLPLSTVQSDLKQLNDNLNLIHKALPSMGSNNSPVTYQPLTISTTQPDINQVQKNIIHINEALSSISSKRPSVTKQPLAEPSIQWDLRVTQRTQTAASNHLAVYTVKGSVDEEFASQKPNVRQIGEISSLISTNLDALKSGEGKKAGNTSFRLPDGVDSVTYEHFVEEQGKTEWCLLRQSGNGFNSITAQAATSLIEKGGTHPVRHEPLTAHDFIRGHALISKLNIAVIDGEPSSSVVDAETTNCTIL